MAPIDRRHEMAKAMARRAALAGVAAFLAVCTSLARATVTPPASGEWRAGSGYTVLSPPQPTSAPTGKVEVLEVFWLACPHCYALEPDVRKWLKTKPAYIDFVRVPVTWDALHRAHAHLYYTLEALGRDDLAERAFSDLHALEARTGTEAVLFSKEPGQTLALQENWAAQHGISPKAFVTAYKSFYVNTKMQRADEITNGYQVDAVPFFAVAGRYATDPAKAGGDRKLFALIDFLAAAVHRERKEHH
jgi:protein dithiol oxidoreductase (disulfide-forming)